MQATAAPALRRPHSRLFGSIWSARWLILELVRRDLKLRYRRSVLGFLWTLLNPLLFMSIYTLVFSVYLRVGVEKFPVFLLAGCIPWGWFAGAMSDGTGSITAGSGFITCTAFPSEILPLASVCSHMMNMIFSLPVLFLFLLFFQVDVGLNLLALPVVMLVQFVFTTGLVWMTGTCQVYFRDLQQLLGHILMLLFFATPICYPLSVMPEGLRAATAWSPFAILVESYRRILFQDRFPEADKLGLLLVLSLGLLGLGWRVLQQHKERFADAL